MANNLSNRIKTTRVAAAAAAGSTDVNCTGVDMANFEGVRFTALFGTLTSGAVTGVHAQQSSDNDDADAWADIAGSSISVADSRSGDAVVLDIWRPTERYVRLVIDRATQNAVVDGAIAEQYGPRLLPTTDDSTTMVTGEIHTSPAEGTA